MTIQGYFVSQDKSKETFLSACDVFRGKGGPQLRGHVEFIYAALKHMEEFGVHKDLEVTFYCEYIYTDGLFLTPCVSFTIFPWMGE